MTKRRKIKGEQNSSQGTAQNQAAAVQEIQLVQRNAADEPNDSVSGAVDPAPALDPISPTRAQPM